MNYGVECLEEVGLTSLDEQTGKPKHPSRLPSANAVRQLYNKEVLEDQTSATARVRIQAMKDGQPPYNQAALNATGQGSRANANFLMGQDLISNAANGYHDIITSPKILVTLDVELGEASERADKAQIIQEEVTRTIRKWPSFTSNFLLLVDMFVTHGVGIGYFPDTRDFRFEVAGFAEFLIPRQTKASEEAIIYSIARRDMTIIDLYDHIRNEDAAKKLGWNPDAVKKAIGRATTDSSNGEVGEFEAFQKQIKNNDLDSPNKFEHVAILNIWVKEFDGTYSFAMVEKDAPSGEFLFKEFSKYKTATEAFVFFCYGIGNGTYHSVRGMGQMIFALVQLHNRLMCQKSDGVMLDESIMLQSTSANSMQQANLNYLGPFALLDQGFEVVDRKVSGTSERTLPFLAEVKGLMGQVASRFNAPQGGTYQNELNAEAELEAMAGASSGALDLFYASWDRILREVVKRIILGTKSDPLVAEFHKRCERAGLTPEDLKSVDFDTIYAYRALGAGSPAARSMAFKKLMVLLPQLDEIGRKNLIYEFVSNLVGYRNAAEFASRAEEPRQNSEASIATLENFALQQGFDVPVLPYQMHGAHVQIHIPPLLQILDGVDRGEIDPMQSLPGLQAMLNHLATHGEELAQDPSQAVLYGQVKEAINNLQQVVTNMERKIKAEERKIAEAGGTAGGEATGTDVQIEQIKLAREQMKFELEQFKFDLAKSKGELDLATQQAKAQQNLALNDAKGADAVLKKSLYPRSDYSERR